MKKRISIRRMSGNFNSLLESRGNLFHLRKMGFLKNGKRLLQDNHRAAQSGRRE